MGEGSPRARNKLSDAYQAKCKQVQNQLLKLYLHLDNT
jgi:hypothetical protein